MLPIVGVVMALLAGCATTPKVGVRPDFQDTRVREVAVVEFYATSTFSLPRETLERVIAQYEAAATTMLREMGFDVVTRAELREMLARRGALQDFSDGVDLRNSLEHYFEPTSHPETIGAEVAAIRRLHAGGNLPVDALFVGEVVYQSQAECDVDPRTFNERAIVVAPGSRLEPGPCIVSHFQAKLVDPVTGSTMWHNRVLREVRGAPLDEALRERNIVATVQATVAGAHGVGGFRAPGAAEQVAQSTSERPE